MEGVETGENTSQGNVNTTAGVKVSEEKLMNGSPFSRKELDKEGLKAAAVEKVKAAFNKLKG